jgi:hypothetical protein
MYGGVECFLLAPHSTGNAVPPTRARDAGKWLPGKWLLAYGFARVEMGSRLYRSGGRDGWVNTTIDATTGARPSVPGYNIHLIDQVVSVSLRLANT